jgi:hypothetical protein
MKIITAPLYRDLESLYNKGYVEEARILNQKLGGESKTFYELADPMYFVGDTNAPTVFVMLNPGAKKDKFELRKEDYKDVDDFFARSYDRYKNYGKTSELDNFDLKQAAFLYSFKESGIDIPNFIDADKKDITLRRQAKENVLLQKLQLELIPYASMRFDLAKTKKLTEQNFEHIHKHLVRVLDAIIEVPRRCVLFGSYQFQHIFLAAEKRGHIKIELGNHKSFKILEPEVLKKKVNFNTVNIEYKGMTIKAGIVHSFPRHDLPNAFVKMRKYGELCYQTMKERGVI